MNRKELLGAVRQEEESVISDKDVLTKAHLVSYNGKKYAVNPNAIFTINVTTKCNAHCFFCYNGMTFMRDDDYVDCDSRKFVRAATFAKMAGIKIATITGGEPTLNPIALLKIIQFLKKMGFPIIRVHTNGYFLCNEISVEKKILPLWKWLEIYGVNDLSISVADYRSERNSCIMGIDNLSKIKDFFQVVENTTMRIRLSCFLCSQGIKTLTDITNYLRFAVDNRISNVIFRLMPSNMENDLSYLNEIVSVLSSTGWQVSYQHKKTDSIIYELKKENNHIALSCVKEEVDPDQKIRRLIYMPDGVLYTSWIDPSSFLFDDDDERIICSALRENIFKPKGNYPGGIWNKEVPNYIHLYEMQTIDLHVHSSVSDGLLSPIQVIKAASESGIRTMVFTEHNCLHDSIDKVIEIARLYDVDIPLIGVEFSTVYCIKKRPWMKFHLLVYGRKKEQFKFIDAIYNPNSPRNEYITQIYQKLVSDGIINSSLEDIYMINDDDAPTKKKMFVRSPLANYIAQAIGVTPEEAKIRYLPQMKDEDRYKEYLDTERIIELAHQNGCVAVLAHPGWVRSYDKNRCLSEKDVFLAIANLARSGLDGIEIVHRQNSDDMRDKLYRIASELGIIITGGSDFHGKARCKFGENGAAENELQRLMEKVK